MPAEKECWRKPCPCSRMGLFFRREDVYQFSPTNEKEYNEPMRNFTEEMRR
jgi:hypothetical protein